MQPGDVVSFTGGGGKTTSLFRAAAEFSRSGASVLLTTTTRMNRPDLEAYDYVVLSRHAKRTRQGVTKFLAPGKRILVTGKFFFPRKIYGIPTERVDDLSAMSPCPDLILVEADGSRQRPLKGHADWEPVIPASTTLTVAVFGFGILGKPLHEEFVHRADIAARIAGVKPGDPVTPSVIERLLTHPDTFFRGTPPGARRVIFIAGVPLLMQQDAIRLGSRLCSCMPGTGIVIGNITTAGGVQDLWLDSL